jgi:hypothetical protein
MKKTPAASSRSKLATANEGLALEVMNAHQGRLAETKGALAAKVFLNSLKHSEHEKRCARRSSDGNLCEAANLVITPGRGQPSLRGLENSEAKYSLAAPISSSAESNSPFVALSLPSLTRVPKMLS